MNRGAGLIKSDCGQVLLKQRRNQVPNQLKVRPEISMSVREKDEVVEAQ